MCVSGLNVHPINYATRITLHSHKYNGVVFIYWDSGELEIDRTSGSFNITLERNQLTVFSTSFSVKGENQSDGKSILKPMLLVTSNNQAVLKGEGETII